MARRNLFQPPPPPGETPAKEAKSRFPNTGAMSGVKSTLKDLSSNAVREIPVAMIEEDGPPDRLDFGDADVAALVDSIREHGQQVPIMLRPMAERPGHYRIVYGRRRLRALRVLDQPAKALVRTLSDEEAVLAQGQENSQRLDPSFVEKALFADGLRVAGYEPAVILDALAIDKPMLSRMAKVVRAIPRDVIGMIGPAHGVGRRRWEGLADLVLSQGVDVIAVADRLDLESEAGSDVRFKRIHDAVTLALKGEVEPPCPARPVHGPDGGVLAEIKDSPRSLTLKLSKSGHPGFAGWLSEHAEAELLRLYEAWQSEKSD